MKIAIYSRVVEFDQHKDVQQLFDELAKENIAPVVWQPFLDTIKSDIKIPSKLSVFSNSEELDESVDFLISLGGDGTLLDTVTLVRDKNIPVLGINFGRLGFLSSIGRKE